MPVMDCVKDGKKGKKCGESGHCFTGPDAEKKAKAVCALIHIPQSERNKK